MNNILIGSCHRPLIFIDISDLLIFTVRNAGVKNSVHSGGHPLPSACWDIHPPGRHPLGRHPEADTPQTDTPSPAQCMLGYTHPIPQCMLGYTPLVTATAADGTHPTGMHSCKCCNISRKGLYEVIKMNQGKFHNILEFFRY